MNYSLPIRNYSAADRMAGRWRALCFALKHWACRHIYYGFGRHDASFGGMATYLPGRAAALSYRPIFHYRVHVPCNIMLNLGMTFSRPIATTDGYGRTVRAAKAYYGGSGGKGGLTRSVTSAEKRRSARCAAGGHRRRAGVRGISYPPLPLVFHLLFVSTVSGTVFLSIRVLQ